LQDYKEIAEAPLQIHNQRNSDHVFSQVEELAAEIPDASRDGNESFPPAVTKSGFEADMLASLRKRQVPIPEVENLDLGGSEVSDNLGIERQQMAKLNSQLARKLKLQEQQISNYKRKMELREDITKQNEDRIRKIKGEVNESREALRKAESNHVEELSRVQR
jgi:hypothetical protein